MSRCTDVTNEGAVAALRTVLPGLAARAARDAGLVSARRTELGNLLAAEDLRKVADTDAELSVALALAGKALTEDEQAAAAWQKALSEATAQWEAMLTDFARLHAG